MKCPLCNGHGDIEQSKARKNITKTREYVFTQLYNHGFSYREIAKMHGVAHNSVYRLINKKQN